MEDVYNSMIFHFKYDKLTSILQLILIVGCLYFMIVLLLVILDKITQRQLTNWTMIISGVITALALLLGIKLFISIPITLFLEFAYLKCYLKIIKYVEEDEKKGITSCSVWKRKEQEERYLNSIKDKSK